MDKKQILADLRAARKAIDNAIKFVTQSEAGPTDRAASTATGTCAWCKKVITSSDETTRGVHQHCYNEIYGFVRRGEKTLKELEAEGFLEPPRISGRPKKSFAAAVDAATNTRRPLKKMPRRKK